MAKRNRMADVAPDEQARALRQIPLSADLQTNLDQLSQLFQNCSDLVTHSMITKAGQSVFLIYVDGLVEKNLVDRDLISRVVKATQPLTPPKLIGTLTTLGDARPVQTVGDLVYDVLSGDAVLLLDGANEAVVYGVRGWETRAISEPITEAVIRGPREGFVETLRVNTALLRRRVRSTALKMERITIGRLSQTDLVITYIHGVADPDVVQEVRRRLGRIDVDAVLEGGAIEQFIEDSPFSIFPQIENTERPDTATANLLEGRVLILVDGTPFVLMLPVVFGEFMQAAEDYYERFIVTSMVRSLRYLFLFVAMLLPSLYVAIITYHQEMVPTPLLLSIAAAREGIPFPAFVEALLMEVTFEILREAGIRLPRPVGQAVSIVGALVIGEAAVRAGIVSSSMVIVVASTGIASFAIPKYNAAIAVRMLRFPLIILAGTLGLFGVVSGICMILLHLCSLRSFGVPYLSPVAPLNLAGLKDLLIRAPIWMLGSRPKSMAGPNPVRQVRNLRPGVQHGPRRRT